MSKLDRHKVLEVIQPIDGGSAVHVLQLLSNLDLKQFEVHLVAPSNPNYHNICDLRDIKYHVINFRRTQNPLNDIVPFFKLYWLCRQERYDVVHMHCTKAGLLGRIAARLAGAKVVYTPHGLIYTQPAPRLFQQIYYWLERSTLPLVSKVIFVSASEAEVAIKDKVLPRQQAQVIVNGVGTDISQRGPDKVPIVVMVSRFEEPKKPEDLIKAVPMVLAKHKNVTFALIGDGSKRSTIDRLIDELGIAKNVKMLGFRDDITAQFCKSSIAILCSSSEGLPYVALEAMACGRPVIGSRVKGVIDVVHEGENGLLYELGNSHDLAAKIVELLDDPKKAREYGKIGRKMVLDKYSIQGMIDATQLLYSEVK